MRQPAYSKGLRELLHAGREPQHGIAVYLDQRPPSNPLCAPLACFSGDDPSAIDWSLCTGRDVHIPNAGICSRDRLVQLVRAIRAAQPRRLQVHRAGRPTVFVVVGEDQS